MNGAFRPNRNSDALTGWKWLLRAAARVPEHLVNQAVGERCLACGELRAPARKTGDQTDPPWALALAATLCPGCAARLTPRLGGFCPRCGMLFGEDSQPAHLCGSCLLPSRRGKPKRPWRRVMFYGRYHDLLRQLILAFKFSSRLDLGHLLRTLLATGYALRNATPEGDVKESDRPELVVPVPLHPSRLFTRGFNQSLELARALQPELPISATALHRIRPTRPQTELRRKERQANIQGAFAADAAQVAGRRLLLVDDVVTTGATINEACRTLIAAGAAAVDVLVLGRTPEG